MDRTDGPPRIVFSATLFAGLTALTSAAEAGGFAVREQSTYGLGMAFAGIAAGETLSSMFWNPAAVSAARELELEADATLLLPVTQIAGTASFESALGVTVPLPALDPVGGPFASQALIPALYAGAPVTENLAVGLAFNAPLRRDHEA